jgi:hypothetical protein
LSHDVTIPDPSCTWEGRLADIGPTCTNLGFGENQSSIHKDNDIILGGQCFGRSPDVTGKKCDKTLEKVTVTSTYYDGHGCSGTPTATTVSDPPLSYYEANITNCSPIHEPHASD